jgi:hypothetical protein
MGNGSELNDIRAAALAELKRQPVRRRWWVDAVALVSINAVFTAVAALALSWPTAQHSSQGLRWAGVAILATLVVVGGILAIRPGVLRAQQLVLGLAAVCLGVMVLAASGTRGGPEVPFLAGVGCGVTELALSLLPAGATALVLARFAFQPLRAFAGGLAAGAGGVLVLHLHCPNGELVHLLTFHVLAWVAVAAALVVVRGRLRTTSFVP